MSWRQLLRADLVPARYGSSGSLIWAYTPSKLLLSDDIGLHWAEVPISIRPLTATIEGVFVEPSRRLWVALNTEDSAAKAKRYSDAKRGINPELKLYSSSDSGRTWLESSWRSDDDQIGSVQFFDPRSGLVATRYSVYWTSDGGVLWHRGVFDVRRDSCRRPSCVCEYWP